jgi:hypothetical protein
MIDLQGHLTALERTQDIYEKATGNQSRPRVLYLCIHLRSESDLSVGCNQFGTILLDVEKDSAQSLNRAPDRGCSSHQLEL